MRSIMFISIIIGVTYTLRAQQDFKIIESTSQKVVVSYSPAYLDTTIKSIDGNDYRIIRIANETLCQPEKTGSPQIPSRCFQIGVPELKGNQIRIRSLFSTEITGILPPFPKAVKTQDGISEIYEKGSMYYSSNVIPDNIVSESSAGSIRNLPVLTIRVNIARLNPRESKITLIRNIEFEISFPKINITTHSAGDQFLSDVVINGDIAQGVYRA